MHAKTLVSGDPVFIHYTKRPEMYPLLVKIIGKRKRMVCIEPSLLDMPAFIGSANRDHKLFFLHQIEILQIYVQTSPMFLFRFNAEMPDSRSRGLLLVSGILGHRSCLQKVTLS